MLKTPGHLPLLWLVVPQALGYSFARSGLIHLTSLSYTLLSLCCFAVAYGLLIRKAAKNQQGTILCWAFGIFLLATGYYQWKLPPMPQGPTPAPREAVLSLEILRPLRYNTESQHYHGYARITDAPAHLQQLNKQRVYFSSLPEYTFPESINASALQRFQARGQLTYLSETSEDSFHQFLRNSHFSYIFSRAKIIAEESQKSKFQSWCLSHNKTLSEILNFGVDSRQTQAFANVHSSMLLGSRGSLSPDQKAQFQNSGTMHLFAVSGLHIGVIAGALLLFFRIIRVPHWLSTIITFSLLTLYIEIIGEPPSAIRALSMIFFFNLAFLLKRKPSPLSALLASAFIVLLIDPSQLFSVGFQLSYGVVAGILLYGLPLIEKLQTQGELFRFVPESELTLLQKALRTTVRAMIGLFGISFSAFLFSTPLTIGYFQYFTPAGIVLNMFFVPVASLAIVAGALSIAFGLFQLSAFSLYFNHAAWVLVASLEKALQELTILPSLAIGVDTQALPQALACEIISLGILLLLYQFKKKDSPLFYLAPPALFTLFLLSVL